jgi:hypothetical protein
MHMLDKHPTGFCFRINPQGSYYDPYCASHLNLCAISRDIFSKETFVVNPETNEGYEDRVFASTLHCKYNEYEFEMPDGISCDHFRNKSEPAPSTWAKSTRNRSHALTQSNTNKIVKELYDQYKPAKNHFKKPEK